MKTIQIFDPALCCSTGVCGVDVDQALVQFSADVDWAKQHPKCVEVNTTVSDAMGGAESAMKILEKIGYQKFGSLYRIVFEEEAAKC